MPYTLENFFDDQCGQNTTESDFKELLSQRYQLHMALQLFSLSSSLFKVELKPYETKFKGLMKLIDKDNKEYTPKFTSQLRQVG